MSKYTTEVRFICETEAGLTESAGFSQIDDILEKSWNKIFTTAAKIFDEDYRKIICKKILKHYYTQEIGLETVGLWKLFMNRKFEEVIGYYNQLWKSELLDFDPLKNIDITRTYNRKKDSTNAEITGNTATFKEDKWHDTEHDGTKTSEESGTNTKDITNNETINNTQIDKYSDTPQGSLQNVDNDTYLTNARKVTNNGTDNTTRNETGSDSKNGTYTDKWSEHFTENTTNSSSNNGSVNGTANDTEEYLENLIGKQGNESYSELILKYRETFINIDMMFIEEFSDLFMTLW